MTTATTTRDIQIRIAYEVLMMDETGKTKKAIADEFNISTRSVNRYFSKYEEEAMDLLTSEEPKETTELKEAFETKNEEPKESTDVTSDLAVLGLTEKPTPKKEAKTKAKVEKTKEEAPKKAAEPKKKKEDVKETKTRKPLERDEDGLTPNQRSILNTYLKQKASGNMEKNEDRKGKVGRAKKNIKTIRYIAMEIIEAHAEAGTLTKANKDSIIEEIRKEAKTDEKTAKQYFSGHKLLFGDFQG